MSASLSEFQLIERFFRPLQCRQPGVLAIGDDAALWPVEAGRVVWCVDTLVAGRHFFTDADPYDVGWKAVAVNVSDLLAMGAEPRAFQLALTLPSADEDWLSRFADGLHAAQQAFGMCLLGGDTTRGVEVVVTVTAMGTLAQSPWQRDGARPGDGVWVTGTLGEAALGLAVLRGEVPRTPDVVPGVLAQLRPVPPVGLVRWLRTQPGAVHAAIDISDGLVQDAAHVAQQSRVDIELHLEALPLSASVAGICRTRHDWHLPLAGGEDYQLLWTAPADWQPVSPPQPVYRIGRVQAGTGQVRVLDHAGRPLSLAQSGFRHF